MMDLSNLSVGDLRNLQDQIKQEMKKREHQEVAKAREQILAIAHLIGTGIRAKTGTVAVRFRHPDNSSQQWTGRGRQPKWVKEWVEGGKSIDKLRV
jgi:DNA-binding protein H-NS